jgi:AcrR family transcriptional regulator
MPKNNLFLQTKIKMTRLNTDIRKEQIKKAVLKIIKDEGINAVSTKNLAAEIGLSEGAIFRHFKKKRDIIRSIVDDVSNDLIGALKNIANSQEKPRTKLREYLCYTINYLLENNGITILLFSEATHSNDNDILAQLKYIFNAQRLYLEQILQEGVVQGIWDEKVNLQDASQLYMGIPVTLNINQILSPGNFDQTDYCNRMLNLIEKMLQKK